MLAESATGATNIWFFARLIEVNCLPGAGRRNGEIKAAVCCCCSDGVTFFDDVMLSFFIEVLEEAPVAPPP